MRYLMLFSVHQQFVFIIIFCIYIYRRIKFSNFILFVKVQDENRNCYGCGIKFKDLDAIIVVYPKCFHECYHEHHLKCYQDHAHKYGNKFQEYGLLYPDITRRLLCYSHLTQQQQEDINEVMFPNLQKDEVRHQLLLSKFNITNLSLDNLIIALQQRDIAIFESEKLCVNKSKMMDRLEHFLCGDRCRIKNEILTCGFCRLSEKEYDLIFPDYLAKLILSFGPTYVRK